jgi:hypothetical protein
LVFWLTVLFTGFGLFAPRDATVVVALPQPRTLKKWDQMKIEADAR